ncbi:MAG: sigma-70 family RNA polymerase sigma factor [Anaerolineae bacterium]|nr:sigma-70 family RNA polymerase sigma factor [Anaerolineae bacterium]
MDDRQAITQLKRGDIGALASLVERYQVHAARVAYLITQDRSQAEDVVQAAFLRAYRSIDGFDSRRPFQPWFMRIVVNQALQTVQRARRELSLDGAHNPDDAHFKTMVGLLHDPAPAPETVAEQTELKHQVRQALKALAPEERAAVVMRYFLDFSEREIAEALGRPTGTVKWRLHEARKQLRILLGHTEAGEG